MSTWHSKSIGDGVAAFGPRSKIQEAYLVLAQSGAASPDVAVFSRYDLKANVVTVYFTPSASTLASAFGATPCDKPTPDKRLSLLVGDARSWQIHFPGHSPGQG
jgi:hypothetical protein